METTRNADGPRARCTRRHIRLHTRTRVHFCPTDHAGFGAVKVGVQVEPHRVFGEREGVHRTICGSSHLISSLPVPRRLLVVEDPRAPELGPGLRLVLAE